VLTRLRESFTHTPRTLALVWRSFPAGALLMGALTLLAALIPLGVAYAGKAIMDAVVSGEHDLALRWVLIELAAVAALAAVTRGLGLCRSSSARASASTSTP
jgi:ATP-binding cassette subfamily B protein